MDLLGHTIYRCTDSGPDNDAKEAHALHVQLVSRGVIEKLVWLRLPPKHSHNLADRVNSMVKEQIWPQRGSGGGCMAPWDMEEIMLKAVKSQTGRTEFAWHWQNCNFKTLYDGHFDKDFGYYKDYRYWVYERDDNLEDHHYCRVTCRKNLLLHDANSRAPEFLPCFATEQVHTLSHTHPCLRNVTASCFGVCALGVCRVGRASNKA